MSTATRPADSAAPARWCRSAYRVVRRRRDTADTWTLTLEPASGDADWRTGPDSSPCSRRSASARCRSRSAATRRGPVRCVHTVRAVGSRDARDLRRAPRRACSACAGRSARPGRSSVPRAPTSCVVAGGIGLAPLRPVLYHALRHRRRFGRVVLLYGSRTPGRPALPGRARALAAARDRRSRARSTPRDERLRRPRRRRHDALSPRPSFEPGSAVAMVCGPEIMMRFVVRAL